MVQVGFIGLGAMGQGLALNLQKDISSHKSDASPYPHLLVWNRTQEKAKPLKAAGAVIAGSVADLVPQCDIVICMLSNDAALRDVCKAVLAAETLPGAIFVDCSTVYPDTTAELATSAEQHGVTYLSCPIFGRPDAVLARKAIVVMAGPAAAKARVRPLLEPLGRAVLDVGESARQGSAMKLTGNFFIASAIELISEGMTLGDASGVGRDALLQFFSLMLPGIVFEGYGGRIAADDFDRKGGTAGFAVDMGIKDASHIQRLARDNKVRAPVIDLVLQHLQQAQAKGRGDADWGAIATSVREASGRPSGMD